MPLSNDFGKKKTLDENDTILMIKEAKDIPNNLLVDNETKSEIVMPIKLEDFERYFETACKSGALHKEYSVSFILERNLVILSSLMMNFCFSQTIQRGAIKACSYGSQTETKPKNRYAKLYPCKTIIIRFFFLQIFTNALFTNEL